MGEIRDLEIGAQLDYSKTTLTQLHEYIYALRDKGVRWQRRLKIDRPLAL